jgi:hypothetical protein
MFGRIGKGVLRWIVKRFVVFVVVFGFEVIRTYIDCSVGEGSSGGRG